jgi:hypothetical protein
VKLVEMKRMKEIEVVFIVFCSNILFLDLVDCLENEDKYFFPLQLFFVECYFFLFKVHASLAQVNCL